MSNKYNIDISEGFLSFLNDEDFNKNKLTFCKERTPNVYHDSNYKWCKYCDKVICSNCILVHMIDNQITHSPIDKVLPERESLFIVPAELR